MTLQEREEAEAALHTAATFREFLGTLPVEEQPFTSEALLVAALTAEVNSSRPRRSILRQLHTRMSRLRQKREWSVIVGHVHG